MPTVKTKPYSQMSDEEFNALMEEPRECKKCHHSFPTGDFPSAKAAGRLMIRSWCHECLNTYIREWRRKKAAK